MRDEKNIITIIRRIADLLSYESKRNPEFAKRLSDILDDSNIITKKTDPKRLNPITPDIHKEWSDRGDANFRLWLLGQPISTLRAVIRKQDFDPSHRAAKWKNVQKLADFIYENLQNRLSRGASFIRSETNNMEKENQMINNENELTFEEKVELERKRAKREKLKAEYLASQEAKDDMYIEANKIFQAIVEKTSKVDVSCSKTPDGHLQVILSHIYILVQFYPQFEEYQIACTFNERAGENNKFKIIEYKFDRNDLSELGWNDGKKFYNSEDLAEKLLNELYEINLPYFHAYSSNKN